jgi:hypothetical protein
MTTRELMFWKWLRDVTAGLMVISGAIAGFRFSWLPSVLPEVCAFATAIAGGLSTFAAGRLPSTKQPKKGGSDGDVLGKPT